MSEPLIKTPVRYDRSTESILDAESWAIATVFMNDPKGEHIAKIINEREALVRVAEAAEELTRHLSTQLPCKSEILELRNKLEEWRSIRRTRNE